MAREHQESSGNAQCLDEALADTFPASDPPSMTSPSAATPSSEVIVEHSTAPLRIYRVVGADQAAEPFAPSEAGGRWSPPGAPCVYASLSPAGAMLEYLAHLQGDPSEGLLLAVAEAPAGATLSELNEPSTWRDLPYRPEVQQVGADWLKSGRSLALRVPSALCDAECNVLLNPAHPGFAAVQLRELRPQPIDPRLR
ncbi:MAG: RES family NAD+ phosphorylase [Pseudomonadota bacterium]|nr:RES family NAD+ phosphorylase [Pseudomonadota bacterium]